MGILTVSRQLGSLGTEVSQRISNKLNIPLLDKDVFENSLLGYGFGVDKLAIYDEKRPGIWESFSSSQDFYLQALMAALYKKTSMGDAIVLGRGGQLLLRDMPGVLNVRLIAPLSDRISRIGEEKGLTPNQAEELIRRSDGDRAGYHQFFFSRDWNDPNLYDLVINTKGISLDDLERLLLQSMEVLQLKRHDPDTYKKLNDLRIEKEIRLKILYQEKFSVSFLDVSVVDGIATISGAVKEKTNKQKIVDAAQSIVGVGDVVEDLLLSYH